MCIHFRVQLMWCTLPVHVYVHVQNVVSLLNSMTQHSKEHHLVHVYVCHLMTLPAKLPWWLTCTCTCMLVQRTPDQTTGVHRFKSCPAGQLSVHVYTFTAPVPLYLPPSLPPMLCSYLSLLCLGALLSGGHRLSCYDNTTFQ